MLMGVGNAESRDTLAYGLVLGLGSLSLLSLFQGIIDVAIPMRTGGRMFGFTFALVERLGPGLLFLSILVHNLGLAAMLPGLGFLAAHLEPNARARRLIAPILFGALLVSMATAFSYMFLGAGDFDLRFSLPLFLAEATAVVGVAVLGYDELARLDGPQPDRRTIARAFEAVATPLFVAALALIVLSVLETFVVLGVTPDLSWL